MKILCDKKELSRGISTAQKAVAKKTTVPVLSCILITAESGQITITGNDMELGIKTDVIGTVLEPGEIAVEASTIAGIVSKMPNEDITITTDDKFNILITAKKAKFTIPGRNPAEFTRLPGIEKGTTVEIPQSALKDMISQTLFSIAVNDNNKLMTGEHIVVKDGELTITALDGHRIAIRTEKIGGDATADVIIPGKTLSEISKILSDGMEPVSVYFSKMNVLFELDGTTVLSRTIEGQYFAVEQMIHNDYSTKITVNKQELQDCIDRATLLITESAKKPLVITISDKDMVLQTATSSGSMSETIDIAKEGQDMKIGFNPKFMIDVLKVVDSETVDLYMLNPKAPCYIKDEDGKYLYLVLPVNIGN